MNSNLSIRQVSRASTFLQLYSTLGQKPAGHGNQDSLQLLLDCKDKRRTKPCWTLFVGGTKELLLSKLNLLLLFMPVALCLHYIVRPRTSSDLLDGVIFMCSILVLCPLAERLGFITEELALYTNDTLGGLLNASFGNATELIISGFSLAKARDHGTGKRFLRIVQLSLLGSVLGNLLLVLGSAFLVGGFAHPTQSFNKQGMSVNSGLLVMAVGSILLPSTLAATHTQRCGEGKCNSSELALSRFESLFLLGAYTLFLVFQLFTHRHLYESEEGDQSNKSDTESQHQLPDTKVAEPEYLVPSRSWELCHRSIPESPVRASHIGTDGLTYTPSATFSNEVRTDGDAANSETAVEEPVLGLAGSLFWLTVATGLISLFSEIVIATITPASKSLGVPLPFLATIILPIVGNAAEHASAIMFAYKNRMEVTLGVAVGSSTQISVFAIPFTVILAWCMGEDLDLNFEMFEAITLFLAVLLTIIAMNDGTSNWLKGLMLVVTYIFISAGFWLHYDQDLVGE